MLCHKIIMMALEVHVFLFLSKFGHSLLCELFHGGVI